jgi:ATP synthase subunit 6
MGFYFGPLAQFELLDKSPTCVYDIFSFIFGYSESHETLVWLTLILGSWQIFEFYAEEASSFNALDFDPELLITDLNSAKNFNYIEIVTLFFSIIFICNFSGLLPYAQTITSQMLFTLLLSGTTMLIVWGHAFMNNKMMMFNHFLPEGSPLVIKPFIILIEIISTLSRIISLAVRLFANMTSGHALIKILASFGLGALSLFAVWKGFVVLAVVVIFIISLLELLIAFLQTYVFVTLFLIYVSEQE